LDAQVVGVSTDSMEDNLKFTQENDIEFPLVSDSSKVIKKSYGSGRVTYLIDKNGIIRHIEKGVPDNQSFIDTLKTLN
jgi:peroxiredoxin